MPSGRLSPSRSLQKLRTVFSTSSTRPSDPTAQSPLTTNPSTTTSPSTSPTLTLSPTPSQLHPFAGFAGFNFNNDTAALSPVFAASSPSEDFFAFPPFGFEKQGNNGDYERRVIRRKKSCVEIEIERERVEFDGKLVGVVEPRPRFGVALEGIEEVLGGRVSR